MVCQADGCGASLEGMRRDARFCCAPCRLRAHRRGRGMREYDPPLSPYWREYLRLFDRALRFRTPEAWEACHELAPAGSRTVDRKFPEMESLLSLLEEG